MCCLGDMPTYNDQGLSTTEERREKLAQLVGEIEGRLDDIRTELDEGERHKEVLSYL